MWLLKTTISSIKRLIQTCGNLWRNFYMEKNREYKKLEKLEKPTDFHWEMHKREIFIDYILCESQEFRKMVIKQFKKGKSNEEVREWWYDIVELRHGFRPNHEKLKERYGIPPDAKE